MSGEITQQRRVLEKVRNFLVALQRRTAYDPPSAPEVRPNLLAYDISYQSPPAIPLSGRAEAIAPNRSAAEVTAQQMLASVVQEMGHLRSSLMQPLQAELENLRQQRALLTEELRQLELQRSGGGMLSTQSQGMSDLLQSFLVRLQETLPQQIAAAVRASEMQTLSAPAGSTQAESASMGQSPVALQSDQMLINFDATLRIVFDALQRDIQAYQESLSQGLDRMHTLGQQSEVMFSALISHLAQQLGREASYLHAAQRSELGTPESVSEPVLTRPPAPPPPIDNRSLTPPAQPLPSGQVAPFPTERVTFPYPGVELSPPSRSGDPTASPVDTAIDAWIRSVGSSTPAESLEVAELDLSDLNLSELDRADAPDIDALLELQSDSQPPASGAQATDLDIALKLLEQLRGDALAAPTSSSTGGDRAARDFSPELSEAFAAALPNDAHDELDELYESLFGSETHEPAEPASEMTVAPQAEPSAASEAVADPTLGWDLFTEPASEPVSVASEPVPTWTASPEPASTSQSATVPESAENDTIHSLMDLFQTEVQTTESQIGAAAGEAGERPDVPVPDRALVGSNLPNEETADLYIQASPGEDLLPTDLIEDDPTAKIWLDETTLNRLHEDLSYLEAIDVEPPLVFESTALPRAETGWTLESVFEETASPGSADAVAQGNAGVGSAADSMTSSTIAPTTDNADFNLMLEGMDDLFGEPSSPTAAAEFPQTSATGFLADSADVSSDEPVFTLEGMDDLFANIPAAARAADAALPPDEIVDLSLEAAFDFFEDAPPIDADPEISSPRQSSHPPQSQE
jgi:hypothetical protein